MKILVTGAKGFVGKNLCLTLGRMEEVETLAYDRGQTEEELEAFLHEADFIVHLAGVNRPKDPSEFQSGNADLTGRILARLEALGKATPFLLSSSIQAALDNPYGVSKRLAEEAVRGYGQRTGAPVYIFRLANVFGKWCRPNYNSAVATWCYNIARDLSIMVRDESAEITLVYIDDVMRAFCSCFGERRGSDVACEGGFYSATPSYRRSLGEITALIRSFRAEPETLEVPDQLDGFSKKLYATYLSYLPEDRFSYPLTMHRDDRGSFTEILHSAERGQVSVNISKPHIVKGNHWHHTKHEKFLVVKGHGAIRFRKMDDSDAKVIEYLVSGDKLEVVSIPPGYTHNIENLGEEDMVTVMWANEVFDPAVPDTYFEKI